MDIIYYLFEIFLHLDKHLAEITAQYGIWTYLILFLIIFAETGFVVTPFLPGDSLLFAAGAIASLGSLDVFLLFFLLTVAAIGGDTVNYWIGKKLGHKLFSSKSSRFIKKEHFDKTHKFYEKYGGKTIIIARFAPIIRTFAPFVAGIGEMTYWKFLTYNVIGGILWIAIFVFGGYFFGNLPFVKNNFSVIVVAIILISLLPMVIEFIKHRRETKDEKMRSKKGEKS